MPIVPAKPRRVGRPSKLTPEKAEKFIEMIKIGVERKDAAAMIGVNSSTIYAWIKAGVRADEDAEKAGRDVSEEDALMVEFSNSYAQARAEYSIGLHACAKTCALAGEPVVF